MISAQGGIDLSSMRSDKRHLLIDFIGKLTMHKEYQNGVYLNRQLRALLIRLNKRNKKDSNTREVLSLYGFWQLLGNFCKKNKIRYK